MQGFDLLRERGGLCVALHPECFAVMSVGRDALTVLANAPSSRGTRAEVFVAFPGGSLGGFLGLGDGRGGQPKDAKQACELEKNEGEFGLGCHLKASSLCGAGHGGTGTLW